MPQKKLFLPFATNHIVLHALIDAFNRISCYLKIHHMEFTEFIRNVVNRECIYCKSSSDEIVIAFNLWFNAMASSEKILRRNMKWFVRKSRFIITRIRVIAVSVPLIPKLMYICG